MNNIKNHYWIIGGATGEVYSSKTNTLVPLDDAAYVAWTQQGDNFASPIANEAELAAVLKTYNAPLPAWLYNAPSFIQPTPTSYSKDQLKAYARDRRWRKEQGGLTLSSGMPILTDDRAQAKVNGVMAAAARNAGFATKWHAADGSVHDMTAAQCIAMSDELQAHIDGCFAISAEVVNQIDAGAITTRDQIDAAFE